MKGQSKSVLLLAAGAIVLLALGCGAERGGSGGGRTSRIPECGFSMELPAGWITEDYAETEFYRRGDREGCWGMAKFCPMSAVGREFAAVAELAKYLIEDDRFEGSLSELISQRPLKLGEVQTDAHEIIFKDTRGGYNFTVFMHMEDREALQVFFHVAPAQYEAFRRQYPAVIESIHLTTKKADWGKAP